MTSLDRSHNRQACPPSTFLALSTGRPRPTGGLPAPAAARSRQVRMVFHSPETIPQASPPRPLAHTLTSQERDRAAHIASEAHEQWVESASPFALAAFVPPTAPSTPKSHAAGSILLPSPTSCSAPALVPVQAATPHPQDNAPTAASPLHKNTTNRALTPIKGPPTPTPPTLPLLPSPPPPRRPCAFIMPKAAGCSVPDGAAQGGF